MPSRHLILCRPFSSCPQSLPASESFPMSQLFISDGQNTGVSALVSFLPKNTQDRSPLEWTGWISLQLVNSKTESGTQISDTKARTHHYPASFLAKKKKKKRVIPILCDLQIQQVSVSFLCTVRRTPPPHHHSYNSLVPDGLPLLFPSLLV